MMNRQILHSTLNTMLDRYPHQPPRPCRLSPVHDQLNRRHHTATNATIQAAADKRLRKNLKRLANREA